MSMQQSYARRRLRGGGLRRILRVYKVILGVAWEAARGKVAVLLVSAMVMGLFGAAGGLVTKLVVDSLADGETSRALAIGILYVVLAAGTSLLDDLAAVLLQSEVGERISQAVEAKLMAVSAAAAGLEHLERAEFADKVKLVRDRSFVPYFALTNLNSLAGLVLGLSAAAVLLTLIHPLLILAPLLAVPGMVLQFRTYRGHFTRYDDTAIEERLARHYLELATTPMAAKEIRLNGLGRHLVDRHRRVTDGYNRTLFRDQIKRSRVGIVSGALFGAALGGAVGFVGWLAIDGKASLGDVALAVTVVRLAMGQVETASRQAASVAELAFVGERYLWLLDYESNVVTRSKDDAVAPPDVIRDGITFDRVSFVYPGTEEVVLDDVSLFVPAGATLAIVGENGAGKSSLVKLLCRFYDPTDGRILVDGIDLRDLDLDAWRERTGVAFQDFVHFQLVAREAVGVGDLPAVDDLDRVGASARQAGADRVIDRLPGGLETQLGRWFAGGVDLSEGEWQRVALARGLMRPEPAMLILDEPTASLDPRAEHEVFQSFATMARPTAGVRPVTILVSHRFSTVRMADLIVVLHEGRIEELGSHDELLARGGRYAQLFRLQASRYD